MAEHRARPQESGNDRVEKGGPLQGKGGGGGWDSPVGRPDVGHGGGCGHRTADVLPVTECQTIARRTLLSEALL